MFFLPVRSRPNSLRRFIEGYLDTGAVAPVVVGFDEDDPHLREYRNVKLPPPFIAWHGPGEITVAKINKMAAQYPDSYYGFLGDDSIPCTPGWDHLLIATAGLTRMAYPDDGDMGEGLATHPVLGGAIVAAAGFFAYPKLNHYYFDNFWDTVLKHLGRSIFVPQVKLEHRSPRITKTVDDTYLRARARFKEDRATYNSFFESTRGLEFAGALEYRLRQVENPQAPSSES